jgi:hypothetical protein
LPPGPVEVRKLSGEEDVCMVALRKAGSGQALLRPRLVQPSAGMTRDC